MTMCVHRKNSGHKTGQRKKVMSLQPAYAHCTAHFPISLWPLKHFNELYIEQQNHFSISSGTSPPAKSSNGASLLS